MPPSLPSPKPEVQQLLALYRRLNATDRKAFRLLADAFSGESKTKQVVADVKNDWLLAGILSELSRRGLVTGKFIQVTQIAPRFTGESIQLRSVLVKRYGIDMPKPKYTELLALGDVVARALADYIAAGRVHTNVTLGLRSMLVHVNRALDAIETEFPDYLASGMLCMLVKSRQRELGK
jgi:hypothetical protein